MVDNVEATGSYPVQQSVLITGSDPDQESVLITGSDPDQESVLNPGSDPVQQSVLITGSDPVQQSVLITGSDPVQQSVRASGSDPVQHTVLATGSDPVQQSVRIAGGDPTSQGTVFEGRYPKRARRKIVQEAVVKRNAISKAYGSLKVRVRHRKKPVRDCCNPFNKSGHIRKKVQQLKPTFIKKYGNLYPALTPDSFICARCTIAITAREIRRADSGSPKNREKNTLSSTSSIPVSSDIVTEIPGPSSAVPLEQTSSILESEPLKSQAGSSHVSVFQTKESLKHDVQKMSSVLRVTPIAKVTDKSIIQFYQKLKSGARKQLEPFLTSPETNLSPVAGEKSRKNAIIHSKFCVSCDTLKQMAPLKFNTAETRKDKFKILTSLPQSLTAKELVDITGCTLYMARKSREIRKEYGPWSAPPTPERQKISDETINLVRNYYLNIDNSRVNPDIRRTIRILPKNGGEETYEPLRQMLLTLKELYREFQIHYPAVKISISKFASVRPKQCSWAGLKTVHNTCTCEDHQNFKLIMNACGFTFSNKISEQLLPIFCDIDASDCMLGYCSQCPKEEMVTHLMQHFDNDVDTITYKYWGKEKGKYGVQLHIARKSTEEFVEHLRDKVPRFAKHHFRMKIQQRFIQNLSTTLPNFEDTAIVTVDFAMNYRCIVQDSPQAFHWTNVGITLMTISVQLIDPITRQRQKQKYVVVSDTKIHDATSFHVFRAHFLDKFKLEYPFIQKIVYISDGAASQFKNTKNLVNLMFHNEDFALAAEWHFTATSHGKSECDAIGAIVKGSARRASLAIDERRRKTILSAEDLFAHIMDSENSLHVRAILVTHDTILSYEIANKLKERYSIKESIKGTQKCHAFIPMDGGKLMMKEFSESTSPELVQVLPALDKNITNQIAETDCTKENNKDFQEGDYWAFGYRKRYFVGIINKLNLNEENEIETIDVHVMRHGKGNSFSWYNIPKYADFLPHNSLLKLSIPLVSPSGKSYRCTEDDYHQICTLIS